MWAGVLFAFAVGFLLPVGAGAQDSALLDIERRVTHGFATNNTVRIHYAALGQGPLVVMIHGFPNCWPTWRHVMEALAKDHEAVAVDQRGNNLSDKPKGAEQYVEDPSLVVKVKCPVLMIHGLKDTALLSAGLNGNWDFVEKDFTLVTIPDAGHFVQQDGPDLVTRSIRSWLGR